MLRSLFKRLLLAFTFLLSVSGCATSPSFPTGSLLVVRVVGNQAPDALSLQITKSDQSGAPISVNGVVHGRPTGRWTDFLFPMSTAPGQYVISHENPQWVPFRMNFEVSKNTLGYMGRLVVFQDRDRAFVLEDHYSEDILMFRERFDSLRSVGVLVQLGSLAPETRQDPSTLPESEHFVEVVPVGEEFLDQIPWQAREAFNRYLKMPSPRAFAINEEGKFGLATGKNVVSRALQECSSQNSKQPCRIFSVDQSIALIRSTGAPVPPPLPFTPPGSRLAPPLSAQAPFSHSLPIAPPVSSVRQSSNPSPAPSLSVSKSPSPPVSSTNKGSPTTSENPCLPAQPNFKGWLRLSDIIPEAAGSKRPDCAK